VSEGPYPHASVHAAGLALQLRRAPEERLIGASASVFPCATDGSFRIDGIPSGRWQVFVSVDDELHHVASIDFQEGETVQRDLDIHGLCRVDAELQFFVDGQPPGIAEVWVYERCAADLTPRVVLRWLRSDANGRVRLQAFAGSLVCKLQPAGGGPQLLTEDVTVPANGSLRHVFNLQTGELSLRLLRADGEPAAKVPLLLKRTFLQQVQSDWSGTTDASGAAAGRGLASGPAVVTVRTAKGSYLDVGTIEVPVGPAPAPIELRLPPDWDR
jgi:hypothetical protein